MISDSPLKKCWKPGMLYEKEINCLIVIDDTIMRSDYDKLFINYLFTKIHNYTYEASFGKVVNPLQYYFFWKSIRSFFEFRHREIMNDNLRVRLLKSNIYKAACYQEMMFQKIDM